MQVPKFTFEQSLIPTNCRYLLGIDEVGRGPLAGPVTIGAFLLDLQTFDPQEFTHLSIRDSKLLSSSKRQQIDHYFATNTYQYRTFSASSFDIDKRGIAVCIYSLITSALEYYHSSYDFCLIDGNYNLARLCQEHKDLEISKIRSVIKGDQQCFSIAAASIVAKVDRDSQMDLLDKQYPQYGFSQNKGYGTAQHLAAIAKYGPCPIHRHSFQPIATFS